MPYLSLHSPYGDLTLFEEDGALVALDWGWVPEGQSETPLLVRAREQLEAYFDGHRKSFDLPFRPHGTPFQRRVWEVMQTIPFGGSLSYAEVAQRLGSGPRAVGGACGRNPLPILIPCHRVLGRGGALGGYSGEGGVETKRRLLAFEATFS